MKDPAGAGRTEKDQVTFHRPRHRCFFMPAQVLTQFGRDNAQCVEHRCRIGRRPGEQARTAALSGEGVAEPLLGYAFVLRQFLPNRLERCCDRGVCYATRPVPIPPNPPLAGNQRGVVP
jgi:hypothetical protein